MTNEQILEAENLLADIKNELSLIGGTTDVEKLLALVLGKMPHMVKSFLQLSRQRPELSGVDDVRKVSDWKTVNNALTVILAIGEMAERRPVYREKLSGIVAREASAVDS